MVEAKSTLEVALAHFRSMFRSVLIHTPISNTWEISLVISEMLNLNKVKNLTILEKLYLWLLFN